MALRPALVHIRRCPEEDAINGARTHGDATAIAAARSGPRSKLHVQRRYICENSFHCAWTGVSRRCIHSFILSFWIVTSWRYKYAKTSLCINAKTSQGVCLVHSLTGADLACRKKERPCWWIRRCDCWHGACVCLLSAKKSCEGRDALVGLMTTATREKPSAW